MATTTTTLTPVDGRLQQALYDIAHAFRRGITVPAHLRAYGGPWWQSPQGLWLDLDDALTLTFYGTAGFPSPVTVGFRVIDTAGRIVSHANQAKFTLEGGAHRKVLTQFEGLLIAHHAVVPASAPPRGALYVRSGVDRNVGPNDFFIPVLFAGYLSQYQTLIGWPGSGLIDPLEGPGYTNTIVGAAPAAGADIAYSTVVNYTYRVRSVSATLTTSATAGNRQVVFVFGDGTNNIWRASFSPAQVASTTRTYQLGSRLGYEELATVPLGANAIITSSLPDLVLRGGYTFASSTTGLLVGDQWSTQDIAVEQWISP